jgi:hypothetical protein
MQRRLVVAAIRGSAMSASRSNPIVLADASRIARTPDGWGGHARIGILTPQADVGPEAECQAMAPEGRSIHAARVPLGAHAPGGQSTGQLPVILTAQAIEGRD